MLWTPLVMVGLVGSGVLLAAFGQRHLRLRREAWIRQFAFPRGVFAKVIQKHPQLSLRDMELVSRGLRQFFLAYLRSGKRQVSMPSQVADDLWHEFILYTRHYQLFCRRAFGGFLHHTPAAALSSERSSNIGLRRCWRHACLEENIQPRRPSRLPLLFALDAKFAIAGGYRYALDCAGPRREGSAGVIHCAVDFASSVFDGSTTGLDADSRSPGDAGGGDLDGGHGDGGHGGDGDGACGGGGCGGD